MRFVFVSNYFNHHQKPFCEEMYRRLGPDFVFISTSVMREERKSLGYAQDDRPPYVHLAYEGEQQRKEALALIDGADVVMAGSAPEELLLQRIRAGKLLLRYSERPFKKKTSFLKRICHAFRFRQRDLWRKDVYMLCASAYAAGDYASIGMYKDRSYKWGYFPALKDYDVDALLSGKRRNTLLWCGRFIDWKHSEHAIMLAHRLKEHGYDFRLDLVGTGTMEPTLRQMVEDFGLTEQVCFLGSMSPDQVRVHMERAGIYLFTSDRQEGWGAVLNESMNSGCTVVASHWIGSVPYLIREGENGCIYRSGDLDMLFEKVRYLLDHPEERVRIGRAAYRTVADEWNARTAADRLLRLVEALLAGTEHPSLFQTGPCSKAEILDGHIEMCKC